MDFTKFIQDKKIWIISIVVIITLICSAFAVYKITHKTAVLDTLSLNIENKDNKKPAVIMFYSPRCTYCVRFEPKFQELAKKYKDKYNFVIINIAKPESRSLLANFRITSLPTLYIVDSVLNNQIHLNNGIYGSNQLLQAEFDRYLRIRSMIPEKYKKGN